MSNFSHFSRLPDWKSPHFIQSRAGYDNERKLVGNFLTEMFNHHGVLTEYICVSFDTAYDKLFGEDNDQRIERKFQMMTYFELSTEEDRWTPFGIEGLDSFSIYTSYKIFTGASGMTNPRVGDIIKPIYNDYYYEITAWYDGQTGGNFLQKDNSLEMVLRKFVFNHQSDPNNILDKLDLTKGMVDDKEVVDMLRLSHAIPPPSFPSTTGAGKINPFYVPPPTEKPPTNSFGGF